ncbi:MAG: hypothetical protein IPP83_07490 [Flavobacteriales bacterium]|nr:hypothetical protein [Flavobacteriales bacterium]
MLRNILEHLRNDLKRIRTKDSFARNVFTVFSGNSVVLLSQLALTPLIARVYGPEAYGIYGLFYAILLNMAAFTDLGYGSAYVLPKEDKDYMHLLRLNLTLLAVVVVLALGMGLLREPLYTLFPNWRPMGAYLLLLPIGLLAFGLIYFFTNSFTRFRAFRLSVMLGSTTTIALRGFNLGYGLLTRGAMYGLIVGEVVVNAVAAGAYTVAMRRHGLGTLFSEWSWASIRRIAMEYKRYPLFTFPERWIAQLGSQLPIFLLIADPVVVGHFAISTALLLIPLRLLGYSLNTVYIQKAAETVDADPALLGRITLGLYQRLFWIGLVPFTAMMFFSDVVFGFIMGDAWRGAGVITAYMGLFYFFRLTSEPMSTLFYAQRREHRLMIFQVILAAARLVVLLVILATGLGAANGILGFSIVSALGYLILGHLLLQSSGQNAGKLTLRAIVVTAVACAVFMGLRFLIIGDIWPTL